MKRHMLTYGMCVVISIIGFYSFYCYISTIKTIQFAFDSSLSEYAQEEIQNFFPRESTSYLHISNILEKVCSAVPCCKSISARLQMPHVVVLDCRGHNAVCLCNDKQVLLDNATLVSKELIASLVITSLPSIDFFNGVVDIHSLQQLVTYIKAKPVAFFDRYHHAWRDQTFIAVQPKNVERVTLVCDINSIDKLQKLCTEHVIKKVRADAQQEVTIDTRFRNQIIVTGIKGGGNGSC